MRALIFIILVLLPISAAALDCTPFQSWTCEDQGYYNVLDGQPGELLCGVDYTGWTFHVVEVAVTQPGWLAFQGVSAAASWNIVDTAIILMDDCSAGTCISSAQGFGVVQLDVCLDYGIYKFVVASDTTAPTAFMNIGIQCRTCEEAALYGFDCDYCQTVADARSSWGSVKAQYR